MQLGWRRHDPGRIASCTEERRLRSHSATASRAGHTNTGIGRIKLGRALLRSGRYAEAAEESFAGYEIVSRQASPGVSFLKAARRDLIAAYDSLRTPEKGARFRAEIADSSDGIVR